ncbi:FAD-binding oxidoreductase [Enemella evansiae]|uniref:FAD-binding oxidoreductase n=1 Tax=Enemella evansiae TaxID=2016499 RepID=UPI000B97BE32|nr:FAD-binding oxidoreductase [Enemella evansiae]OYO05962.1 FAD-binding oxidoreductase [Enemella evansiae]
MTAANPTDERLHRFLTDVRRELGPDAVSDSPEVRTRYGDSELPSGPCLPAAVAYPRNTAEVQTMVRLASRHVVPLHAISTGQNVGLGNSVAVAPGTVTLDLGRHLDRILEFDDRLNYVVVEPGVSYAALAAFLVDRGDHLMCDTTSGPPTGGPLGNTLDKGGGYTPAADHFGNSCGLEVVLGDGRVLRTGDGASPDSRTWHIAKYGFGPVLDGLFLQSNLGIVTRMGIWLMPRPPVIRSFFFIFPDDDDIAEIVEIARTLKFSGLVPTAIKATGDLYSLASHIPYPDLPRPLTTQLRRDLHREHDVGAWIVSGALYGSSEESIAPALDRVRRLFTDSGKGRFIDHDEALGRPELKIHIDTYSGRPTETETAMVDWRGGGIVSLTPATPMIGEVALEHQRLSRRILDEHGLDTCIDYIFAGRASRGLHSILFDPSDPQECADVTAASAALRDEYRRIGYPVGRAPADMQVEEMSHRDEVFREVLHQLKGVFDPNRILSPGRYGMH